MIKLFKEVYDRKIESGDAYILKGGHKIGFSIYNPVYSEVRKIDLTEYSNIKKTKEQLKALHLAQPGLTECVDMVRNIDRRLWERKPQDEDFLTVRIGGGITDFSMDMKKVCGMQRVQKQL